MPEPKFVPKPGQIDFTNMRRAPVINCVLRYNGKILIVQRSANMKFYPSYWNGISGFLDNERSVAQKAKDEIKEELGIEEKDIITIYEGEVFEQEEPSYNKTWLVHPILVDVNTDKITLDWEAQKYEWINVVDAKKYKLLPGFDKVLATLFSDK